MDFHSQTPKGQYDSLSCACLGCCDPASGAFIPPTVGPKIHKFALCNPDDHKVCGPQPRPAPANAIIFSGIGRITPTDDIQGGRAAQAEWIIERSQWNTPALLAVGPVRDQAEIGEEGVGIPPVGSHAGDAGLLELCSFCLRMRRSSRRQRILPVERSSVMTYN